MPQPIPAQGLRLARLLMVLSSISPLFILWAIRGSSLIPDGYFALFCALMIALPNLFLWLRIRIAQKLKDRAQIAVGKAEDHKDHLLIYLFAMLLPFYTISLSAWRDFGATLGALIFIIFLFWHLNLHYMNVLFALFGYRVFTIHPPKDDNPISGRESKVLITRRTYIPDGEKLIAYRLSDTVYFE